MSLKKLMEDKQLDFNQPLLSVRRFSPTATTSKAEVKRKTDDSLPKIPPLPVYKSELKSGPIRNPGTVPFMWEQTPGRPKDERKPQSSAPERPPIAPKLPPGRSPRVEQPAMEKSSKRTNGTWSHTGHVISSTQTVSSSDKNETKRETSVEGKEETEISSSEDGDEAYVDARDTLSRTESFFWNCSVSGVSGLDGPEVKPSGVFSTDPQTRDFMMDRFLPAAKAMASETPPYTTRRQPIAQDQPRSIGRMVNADSQRPLKQYTPKNLQFHAQDKRWEESDDEDDYDGPGNSLSSVCGLFPRNCLKNSLCLLNPVPGMRVQGRERGYARSSYASSCSETENGNTRDAVYEQRSTVILESARMQGGKIELKSESEQMTCGSKCQNLDEFSVYRRVQGDVRSPNKNENCHSVFSEEKGFLGIPEKAKNYKVNGSDGWRKGNKHFRELLASEMESDSASPAEKTLYIDSVHKVKSPTSNSSSTDRERPSHNPGDDFDAVAESKEMKETPAINTSLGYTKHLNVVDEKAISRPKSQESVDSNFLCSPDRSAPVKQIDLKNTSSGDEDLANDLSELTRQEVASNAKIDLESELLMKLSNQERSHGRIQDSISSTTSKMADDGKIHLNSRLHKPFSSQESSHRKNNPQLPLSLQLPKAPSESWLKRTLPTVSTKNSPSWCSPGTHNYNTKTQAPKMPSVDPKWETIVKTSNVQHGHLRFSEDLLAPIPEN